MDLTAYLKSLNSQKLHLMDDPDTEIEAEKDYRPYIVNRCFSNFPDTLLHAQEMNLHPFLDNRMQYDYLFYAVRKRSRFSPWHKAIKPEDLDLVKEYYGFNNTKAKEALKILTDDELDAIRLVMNKGGLKRKIKEDV